MILSCLLWDACRARRGGPDLGMVTYVRLVSRLVPEKHPAVVG